MCDDSLAIAYFYDKTVFQQHTENTACNCLTSIINVFVYFGQETEGVCVVTFGPATDFPAFFTPRSGHSAPYNVRTPEAAADIVGL